VAGMPHKRLGQEVALFVETKGEGQHISISDIQHVLSDTPFWQPRRIIEVSHFLYTSSGKVRRSEVVKQALQAEKAKV
jgi:acyl-CoA synthetase (AMP-forming)/AMP-acid ligase II